MYTLFFRYLSRDLKLAQNKHDTYSLFSHFSETHDIQENCNENFLVKLKKQITIYILNFNRFAAQLAEQLFFSRRHVQPAQYLPAQTSEHYMSSKIIESKWLK